MPRVMFIPFGFGCRVCSDLIQRTGCCSTLILLRLIQNTSREGKRKLICLLYIGMNLNDLVNVGPGIVCNAVHLAKYVFSLDLLNMCIWKFVEICAKDIGVVQKTCLCNPFGCIFRAEAMRTPLQAVSSRQQELKLEFDAEKAPFYMHFVLYRPAIANTREAWIRYLEASATIRSKVILRL